MAKEKKFKYDILWTEVLNFDEVSELSVYQYLCGSSKKKILKNIPEDKRFERYAAWKNYLEELYGSRDVELLKEFYRYLNNLKRMEKTEKSFFGGFFTPFGSGILTGYLFPKVMELDWLQTFNDFLQIYIEIFRTGSSVSAIALFLLVSVIAIAVLFFILALILFPFGYVIFYIIKNHFSYNLKENFYEDYMEILQELIQRKIEKQQKAETHTFGLQVELPLNSLPTHGCFTSSHMHDTIMVSEKTPG